MVGHLQIIEVRQQGLKPSAVFFTDSPMPKARFGFDHPERALEHRLYPEVYLESSDLKKRLDLRFIASCRVLINTREVTPELVAFAERAVECGATQVVLASPDDIVLYQEGEWQAWTY